MRKPRLTLAMAVDRTLHVLPPPLIARLAKSCDILDPTPIEDFSTPEARQRLATTEILLTGWGCPHIDTNVLADAPNLALIAHAAGTVKYFLVPEVYERGIVVTHAAAANAIPVAEYTLAAIIFSNKNIFRLRDLYRRDRTRASSYREMDAPIGNFDRTIGIVGASRIGRLVVDLLTPFDYDILLYDPYVPPTDPILEKVRLATLDDLMAQSDVVSIHAPSLSSTRHMIGKPELARMKTGATLINTARGALVDETALLDQLRTGRINAVIDVTDPEIPAPSSDFFTLPNVFLTPHAAGAVGTERQRLGLLAVEEIERFVAGQPLRHAIIPEALERLA